MNMIQNALTTPVPGTGSEPVKSTISLCCNQTVRNAMREAEGLGFVRTEVRRLSAWRNEPNRVTITSPEWLSWLRLAR